MHTNTHTHMYTNTHTQIFTHRYWDWKSETRSEPNVEPNPLPSDSCICTRIFTMIVFFWHKKKITFT